MTPTSRRQFLQTVAVGAAGAPLAVTGAAVAAETSRASPPRPLRPRRLKAGDTIGLVSPASATYVREPFAIAVENLQALGFKVKEGKSLRARNGYFAGKIGRASCRERV